MRQIRIHTLELLTSRLGISPGPFRLFIDEIERWNRSIRLMAKGEKAEPHVVDSLVLALHVTLGTSVVDVGSGGGFPGMVLALARPDLRITLVEPIAKKTSFLTYVSQVLGVNNVTILTARIEELSDRRWDNAVCKAFTDPVSWTALASPIAHTLWYYPTENNMADLPEGWDIVDEWLTSDGRPRMLARLHP